VLHGYPDTQSESYHIPVMVNKDYVPDIFMDNYDIAGFYMSTNEDFSYNVQFSSQEKPGSTMATIQMKFSFGTIQKRIKITVLPE
jgi:hypothetical protein